jgi:rubredoxin
MIETYVCEMCGEEFEKGRSDEDAMRESKKQFGQVPESKLAIICDPCFKKLFN